MVSDILSLDLILLLVGSCSLNVIFCLLKLSFLICILIYFVSDLVLLNYLLSYYCFVMSKRKGIQVFDFLDL
jgi:hypothetical protein